MILLLSIYLYHHCLFTNATSMGQCYHEYRVLLQSGLNKVEKAPSTNKVWNGVAFGRAPVPRLTL